MRWGSSPRTARSPHYAMFWAGPWNERSGWDYLGSIAARLADQGVTPVVQWYYWGGDISPSCVEHGCRGSGAWKSRAAWAADAGHLADALHAGLQGRGGVVVLETEFNKKGVGAWEPFDGYLVEHARIFRERAPELRLALGFGNWEPGDWGRFDRAMAAMDLAGFQTMRASTRDTPRSYARAADAIGAAALELRGLFGKPVLLHDLALSSYGGPEWEGRQERVVRALFARLGDLHAAGLEGVIYRALRDDPLAQASEYYGAAERHMGLLDAEGGWKPATGDWLAGLRAALDGGAPAPGGTAATSATAAFQPRGNDPWVEAQVLRPAASAAGGPWVALPRTSWGTGAKASTRPQSPRCASPPRPRRRTR